MESLGGGAIQPLLTVGAAEVGGGEEHHGCGSEHWRGVSKCEVCGSLTELRIFNFLKSSRFRIWNF